MARPVSSARTAFDALPVVVTGPGEYVTRDGRRAVVREIRGPGSFAVKGALYREFRGKVRPKGFDIWHVSGRALVLNESPRDIVGPWEGAGE